MMDLPRLKDICTGMGGLSYGYVQAGYEVDKGIDIWDVALETYNKYIGNGVHQDLADYYPTRGDYDVIVVGGTPCQDFTLVNPRRGPGPPGLSPLVCPRGHRYGEGRPDSQRGAPTVGVSYRQSAEGEVTPLSKPQVWKRFRWMQSEKDGEVTIQPYDEFPSHVTCPRCGKDTDYNLWNRGGCLYCSDLDKWQERQDKIDEWFLQDENNLYDMRDCPLISGYEFLEDDDISVKFRCTWVETGETVVLTVQQVGQGIPHWKVIAVCDEGGIEE